MTARCGPASAPGRRSSMQPSSPSSGSRPGRAACRAVGLGGVRCEPSARIIDRRRRPPMGWRPDPSSGDPGSRSNERESLAPPVAGTPCEACGDVRRPRRAARAGFPRAGGGLDAAARRRQEPARGDVGVAGLARRRAPLRGRSSARCSPPPRWSACCSPRRSSAPSSAARLARARALRRDRLRPRGRRAQRAPALAESRAPTAAAPGPLSRGSRSSARWRRRRRATGRGRSSASCVSITIGM